MYRESLKDGGKIFSVAPMMDWTDVSTSAEKSVTKEF